MNKSRDPSRHAAKIPRFYIVYSVCLIVVILAITVAVGIVSNRLAEYEAVQPRHVAEDVFNTYFTSDGKGGVNYTSLLADARYDAGTFTTAEIMTYLSEEIGNSKLTFAAGSSGESDTMKYIVRAGDKQIAAINLALSDKTTEHGFGIYEFSYIELLLVTAPPPPDTPQLITITIDIPDGYAAEIDGAAVSTEALTAVRERADMFKYYPSGVTGVQCDVYTVTGLEALPNEVVVTAPDGKRAEVRFDEETNTYYADVVYSDALSEELSGFVTEALEGYASYTHRVPGSGFSKIKKYFDPDSDLYADVEAVGNDLWMEKKPDGDRFEDVYVGEFYELSEGIATCHVSFTQMLNLDGSDRPEVLDMYVFLKRSDDGYRIFEWHQR